MHFLNGWLHNNADQRLRKIAGLDDKEKFTVNRMYQLWQKMLSSVGNDLPSAPIEEFRRMMERELMAKIANDNFPDITRNEKLAYYKQLSSIMSRGNKISTPDPQLVKDVQSRIEKEREFHLQKYKVRFENLSISLQQKVLKLLSRNNIFTRSRLGLLVHGIRKHFLALKNEKVKENFIDDITKVHQKRIEETLVEKPRKALYLRWTASHPKAISKKTAGRRLFLPEVTSDDKELNKRSPQCNN
jgi:hypothetical protein